MYSLLICIRRDKKEPRKRAGSLFQIIISLFSLFRILSHMAPSNMVNVPSKNGVSNSTYGCVSSEGGDYQIPVPMQLCQKPQFPSQLNQMNELQQMQQQMYQQQLLHQQQMQQQKMQQ